MNVVATSLGIRERPAVFLTAIVEATREPGSRSTTMRRRCLRIGDELGLPVRQRAARQLPGRVLRRHRRIRPGPRGLAARCARSSRRCGGGPFVRKLFKRFEGSVRVDGTLLEQTAFVGLMARDRPRGRPRLQARPSRRRRSGAVRRAGHARRRRCRWPSTCGRCTRGRGIAPQRAFSAVASQHGRRTPRTAAMSYTIDGDLYRTQDAGSRSPSDRPSCS